MVDPTKFNKNFVIKEVLKIIILLLVAYFVFGFLFNLPAFKDRMPFDWLSIAGCVFVTFPAALQIYHIVKDERNRVKMYNYYSELYSKIERDPEARRLNKKNGYDQSMIITAYLHTIDDKYGGVLNLEGIDDGNKGQRILYILDSYFEEMEIREKMNYYSKSRAF